MCNSVFLLLGSTYPKAWINLPQSWGKLSHIFQFFKKPTTLLWQVLCSSYYWQRCVNTSYILCNTHSHEFVYALASWSDLSKNGSTYPGLPYYALAELPTFYEIKAEDLPPFGKKTRKIFLLGKYSDIFICWWHRMSLFFPFRHHQTAQK